jgi:hypothetical protein
MQGKAMKTRSLMVSLLLPWQSLWPELNLRVAGMRCCQLSLSRYFAPLARTAKPACALAGKIGRNAQFWNLQLIPSVRGRAKNNKTQRCTHAAVDEHTMHWVVVRTGLGPRQLISPPGLSRS